MSDERDNERALPHPPPFDGGGQGGGMRRKLILKYMGIAIGSFVALLVVLLVAFRFVLARAPEYRTQIQEWVSHRTHLHIEFAKIDARWRFYGPELVFDDAVVKSEDRARTFVSARRVSLAYDVWTAISTFRLAAGRITIEAPELQVIRAEDGHFEVVGQQDLPDRDPNQPFEPDEMPTGQLRIVDARVTFRDYKARRGPWVVPGVSFELKRAGSAMDIEGEANLPMGMGKSLRFDAHTAGKLAAAQALDWKFKVLARDLNLAGWASVAPPDSRAPKSGVGGFTMTGSFQGKYLNDLSAQLRFENVSLTMPQWKTPLPAEGQLIIKYRELDDAGASGDGNTVATETVPVASTVPANTEAPTDNLAAPEQVNYAVMAVDLTIARRAEIQDNVTQEMWTIQLKDLELSRAARAWRDGHLSVQVKRRIATPDVTTQDEEPVPTEIRDELHVDAHANQLVLDNLVPLLVYAPESKWLAHMRALSAHGAIENLKLDFDRVANETSYSINATVNEVGFKAIAKVPGIHKLSGVLSAGHQGGEFELNVRDGTVLMPTVFRSPIPVERLTGKLLWRREEAASVSWRITASDIVIDSSDGHAAAHGEVIVPTDGSSIMVDVQASGSDLQARAAPRYMPAGQLSPVALAWLDRAFSEGSVTQATLELRGPLRAYPFRKNEGLFLINAHIENLSLDYQHGWTPAKQLNIDAEFRNQGMSAVVNSAEVAGLQIKTATGKFIDFRTSELLLDAVVEGDLTQAFPYVQRSPIGPMIGDTFMALSGSGHLHSRVALRLPLKDVNKRRLTIDSTLSDATISLAGLVKQASAVEGKFVIQDYTVKSLAMRGEFLHGPMTVTGGADDRYFGPGAGVAITAEGRAMAAELAELLHLPSSVAMKGALNWRLSGRMPRHARDAPTQLLATIESDGAGLELRLPEPIGKRADEARALKLDVETNVDSKGTLMVRAAFGKARALARVVRRDEQLQFDRAGIRVDGIAPSLPTHTGMRIEGHIERFALDEWLKVKSDRPSGKPLSDYLRAANVHVGEFGLYGYVWRDVRGIMQAVENQWRVDVTGDAIAGMLSVPFSFESAPLEINLTKLDVSKRNAAAQNPNQSDPREFPALRGHVDVLQLAGRPVGAARIALDREAQGLRLSLFELRSEDFTINATGSWRVEGNASVGATFLSSTLTSTSSLTFDLASTDLRATLRAFGYHEYLSGKRGNLHASLQWPGIIDENFLGRASGVIGAELGDGHVLEVEPGAGRLLGLMNVSALQRRLSLDFSDVTEKGFSFDSAHADFEFSNGEAYTNNLLLRGPAGEAGIVGRIGFTHKDLDLTLARSGDIGGGLSVASTVVGGPVLGAAVLAFTKLFKEPLKGVSRGYFSIQGPWESYKMERIDKEEAKQNTSEADAAINESRSNDSGSNESPDDNDQSN